MPDETHHIDLDAISSPEELLAQAIFRTQTFLSMFAERAKDLGLCTTCLVQRIGADMLAASIAQHAQAHGRPVEVEAGLAIEVTLVRANQYAKVLAAAVEDTLPPAAGSC